MAARIVVVAPNWLGDAVMALPAIAGIRAARPGDALVVAGRRSTVPLFTMAPGVDEVVCLDSRGAFGAFSWAEDAASLRGTRAGLAILLPNSFRSAWTAHRAGIAERWGYRADLRSRLLTRTVPRPRGRFHQAEYYLHLVAALTGANREGVGQASRLSPAAPAGIVLPTLQAPAEAQERASRLLSSVAVAGAGPLVGLAPGAAYGRAKQWPPERFAELALDLHRRLGATCLVFGAAADQVVSGTVTRIVREHSQNRQDGGSPAGPPPVVDFAGQTDLPLLVALMSRCASIVSNDSGAMHMAAASGVPVAAVFGSSDERGTAPLPCDRPGLPAHEILTSHAWCRPCMLRECPIDHRCMRGVAAAEVAAAVERQVRR